MGRKRTACNRCAGIKTVCSKEWPCSRCKRLSLSCEYRTTVQVGTELPTFRKKTGSRAEHKRSPNGCISCLARRKKCDERTPICGDCCRLGLSCVPREGRARSNCSPQTTSASLAVPVETGEDPTENDYCLDAAYNEEFDIQPSGETDLGLHETAPYAEWINLMDNDCAREVARKDNLNESSAMVVLPEARASDDVPNIGTMLPITALNNLTGVTSEALGNWSVGESHLLNHFQQVVCRALVLVDDDENPFLLDVVPMALIYLPVRHSLVALSACHLSKVYPDFERNVLRHRSLALQGLKNDLDENDRIESALTTTLLLCLLEICEGNSRKWILHLHGAKALISAYGSEVIEDPLSFLFELYDFLCCITTITAKSPAAPDAALTSVLLRTRKRRRGLHPLFGIARDLYNDLNRINKLAARRRDYHENPSEKAILDSDARDIELSLQAWTPSADASDTRGLREVTAAALAIQWASLMRLHQVMHGNGVSGRIVQTAVENILSALSIIRPGSQVEAHILFPLFMAGVGSTSKANRLTVEYRLNIMETTIGFGNITGAHKLLDCVWQRMNEGIDPDWELLMQTEYIGVVLL